MPSEAEAVESLLELGLTEYEARCFAALTQLSDGTAKEISRVANVPQSRVYDVADQLHERGLVDVQESDPRKYYALPVPIAVKRIRQEFSDHLERASENLAGLESRRTDEDGAWEIATRRDVVNRVLMHVDNAEDEVYLLVGDEALLEPEVLDALSDARERGVTVRVEVPAESGRDRVHDAVPGARVTVSDLDLDPLPDGERGPGRVLMVDGETVLVSAVDEGLVPGETEEKGLWGTAVGHGLVVWMRELLASRRERLDFETGT